MTRNAKKHPSPPRGAGGAGAMPALMPVPVLALVSVLVSVLALSSCSGARSAKLKQLEKKRVEMRERLDANGDGALTCDDARLLQENKFHAADEDGNGLLGLEEFSAAPWSHPAYAREHMTLYDGDHDGLVSYEEFIASRDRRFSWLDRDGDCVVTEQEIAAALKSEVRPQGRRPGGMKGGRGQGGGRPLMIVAG